MLGACCWSIQAHKAVLAVIIRARVGSVKMLSMGTLAWILCSGNSVSKDILELSDTR